MTRSFYYFYSSILPSILTLGVNYVFSKTLSLAEYGAYGAYYPAFNLVLPFLLWGQANAIMMQYFSEKREDQAILSADLTQSLYIVLSCFIGSLILFFLASEIFAIPYLRERQTALLTFVLIAALSEAIKQVFYTLSNCLDDFKIFFWTTNIQGASFIITLSLAMNLRGLFFAIILANVICVVFIYFRIKSRHLIRFSGRTDPKLMKALFFMGIPSILSMFLSSAFLYCDRFIIKTFSPAIFPYYVLASSLAVGAGSLGISALLRAQSIQSLKDLQEERFEQVERIFRRTEMFLLVLCGLCLLLSYFWGPQLFILIFGKAFESSFQYIPSLCLSVIILGAAQFYSLLLIQQKKFKMLVVLQALSLILNVGMSFALSRAFNVNYILVSFFCVNLIFFVAIYGVANRQVVLRSGKNIYFPKWLFLVAPILFAVVFQRYLG